MERMPHLGTILAGIMYLEAVDGNLGEVAKLTAYHHMKSTGRDCRVSMAGRRADNKTACITCNLGDHRAVRVYVNCDNLVIAFELGRSHPVLNNSSFFSYEYNRERFIPLSDVDWFGELDRTLGEFATMELEPNGEDA
jgi:hypothetical protein